MLDRISQLRNLVIHWAEENKVNPSYAWGRLYGQISNVYGIDVYERAKNRNCKPIQVIERDGIIDQAFALAQGIFK